MGAVIAVLADTDYPEADEAYDLLVCHYTGAFIPRRESVVLGPVIPQAPSSYACHPLAGDKRRASVRLFYETEQNCNACTSLVRVPFDRQRWGRTGLMPGKCCNPDRNPLYPKGGEDILFAPDDRMGQACFTGRTG